MIKAIVERDGVDYNRLVPELLQALRDVAEDVRTVLATPPPEKPKKLGGPLPGGFYTERQRGFVMSAIKSGHIRVPYLRTGDLPRSWTASEVQTEGNVTFVEIYSDPSLAPYGRYVQDPLVRPIMHDDWPTPDEQGKEAAQELLPKMIEVCVRYGFTSG